MKSVFQLNALTALVNMVVCVYPRVTASNAIAQLDSLDVDVKSILMNVLANLVITAEHVLIYRRATDVRAPQDMVVLTVKRNGLSVEMTPVLSELCAKTSLDLTTTLVYVGLVTRVLTVI